MRFPPKNYNQDLESAEDRREREAQDLELAKEMAEEDDDLMWFFFRTPLGKASKIDKKKEVK